jgi:hypothetical protein
MCDNASNNDSMIKHLANLVPEFAGAPSQTRCFLHIINLVAKSLIRLFDMKKKDTDQALEAEDSDDEDDNVPVLEENVGDEEEVTDNEAGWVDEVRLLASEERRRLNESILPSKLALAKVQEQNRRTSCLTMIYRSINLPLRSSIQAQSFCRPGSNSCET